MKGLLLAGTFILLSASLRADERDAYGSLVGMAVSAAADKGPDAGEPPKDEPAEAGALSSVEELPAEAPAPTRPRAETPRPARAQTPAPAFASKDDDVRAVAVPAYAPPRIWTRLFASLLPPATRAAAFEIESSTVAARALPAPRPATPASAAGSAQGLLEFVALATAPSGAEVPPPLAVR